MTNSPGSAIGVVLTATASCAAGPRAGPNHKSIHNPGALATPGPLPARGSRGQRPASGGGAPQVGATLAPGQDTNAQPCSTPTRHRPRWASLGRGFHRNAQATAVVPRGDFGPKALGYAPLRVA
jgi:hypothetical protein